MSERRCELCDAKMYNEWQSICGKCSANKIAQLEEQLKNKQIALDTATFSFAKFEFTESALKSAEAALVEKDEVILSQAMEIERLQRLVHGIVDIAMAG